MNMTHNGARKLLKGTRTLIGMAVLALVATSFAGATTLSTPFEEIDREYRNGSGCASGHIAWDLQAGSSKPFAKASCSGSSLDAVVRMGSRFVVNSGPLLASFSDAATFSANIKGTLDCPTPGASASLVLALQKWRKAGSTWELEEEKSSGSWNCQGLVNAGHSDFASFNFAAGQTYRLMLESVASASSSDLGTAIADFCADGPLGACGVDLQDERILLNSVSIPNQAPKVRFDDDNAWYVTGLLFGIEATGTGCDYDGRIQEVTITVTVPVTGDASHTTPGNAPCLDGHVSFVPTTPQRYPADAKAKDAEGLLGSDPGTVDVQILPEGAFTVEGFPPLGNITVEQLGDAVLVRAIISDDESVRAYRVETDGSVLMDTIGSLVLNPGESLADITYDRLNMTATVTLHQEEEWSGAVVQYGTEWWHIRPVSGGSSAPSNEDDPDPTDFPAMATVPVETNPPSEGNITY